jgi:hypothetical protein
MTPSERPALSSVSELLRTAVRAVTSPVTAGSCRNARLAIDRRLAGSSDDDLVLAALRPALARTSHRAPRSFATVRRSSTGR